MTDDDFPRGPGDPDFYGYPGEPQAPAVEPTPTIEADLEDIPF